MFSFFKPQKEKRFFKETDELKEAIDRYESARTKYFAGMRDKKNQCDSLGDHVDILINLIAGIGMIKILLYSEANVISKSEGHDVVMLKELASMLQENIETSEIEFTPEEKIITKGLMTRVYNSIADIENTPKKFNIKIVRLEDSNGK